jgi:hypothetical protein
MILILLMLVGKGFKGGEENLGRNKREGGVERRV